MRKLRIYDRGLEAFPVTLAFQQELLQSRIDNPALPDTLVFVEHEEVFTTGRSVEFQSPGGKALDVPWHEISRGGQATFHGPGQLVGYPIFDLSAHGKDVHVFLRKLEQALIDALGVFGFSAKRREGLTGVWVRDSVGQLKKIASIGVGVKRWFSYHGFALNVTTDLDYFHAISACGQRGEVMTSLAELFASPDLVPPMVEVKAVVAECLSRAFELVPEDVASTLYRRPPWLKAKAPGSPVFAETNNLVRTLRLNTVCEEARCPNVGECWSHRTATFMIMGSNCTRRCSFCSVKDGTIYNLEPLDALEPFRVAKAVEQLALKHVVITSVNRDDLEDMGAEHFNQVVRAIKKLSADCKVELLIPDMQGRRELLEAILKGGMVEVLNHNVETVPRLYKRVRPGAEFGRSLAILRFARELAPNIKTKSGIMVGLGERREEVLELMDELRQVDCNIMTIGQYLRPTPEQLPVSRFVTPEEFEFYRLEGLKRGFSYVESAPLVRSSYHAWKHSEEAVDVYAQQGRLPATAPEYVHHT